MVNGGMCPAKRIICSVLTRLALTSDTRVVFTSDLIPIGGFRLIWQLLGSTNVTNNESNSKSVWKIRNHKSTNEIDLNMRTMMNLVRESKIQKVERREIWKTLPKHRWNIEILKTSPCLNETQVAEVIHKTGQDLNLTYGWNLWIPEEDLAVGTKLYSIFQCPRHLVEAAKLSFFFEFLLTNHLLNKSAASGIRVSIPLQCTTCCVASYS